MVTIFNFFKKKRTNPEIRDLLFGDRPLDCWPIEKSQSEQEPWISFAKANDYLKSDNLQKAVDLFKKILAMPDLESRHYLQSWHFLRQAGIYPDSETAKQLLGVVVEVAMPEGLDILAAYSDYTARYFNYSGAGIVWDVPDDSIHKDIDNILSTGRIVISQIGPWEKPRPPAPSKGNARINFLTPSGLHFGQALFETLANDPIGGPVISAAVTLMNNLIKKTEKKP